MRMGRIVLKIVYVCIMHFDALSWYSAEYIVFMIKLAFILIPYSIKKNDINMNANYTWQFYMTIGISLLNTCILTWFSWPSVFLSNLQITHYLMSLSVYTLNSRICIKFLPRRMLMKKSDVKVDWILLEQNNNISYSILKLNIWMWRTVNHEYMHLLLATSCYCGKAAGTGPHTCSYLTGFWSYFHCNLIRI